MMPRAAHHHREPPDRFYWAVLRLDALPPRLRWTAAAGRPAPARRRRQLGFLLEAFLPVPIDGLHVAYIGLGPDTVLACGTSADAAESARRAGAITLAASSLPAPLDTAEGTPPVSPPNLLFGAYAPEIVMAIRRRIAVYAVAGLVISASLFMAGSLRRSAAANREAAAISAAADSMFASVLGGDGAGASGQPAAVRVASELNRLRRMSDAARAAPHAGARRARADSALAQLLAAWPEDSAVQAESIVIGRDSATLIALAPDGQVAAAFQQHFGDVPGWRRRQPQVRSVRGGVRVTIQFEADGDPPAVGGGV